MKFTFSYCSPLLRASGLFILVVLIQITSFAQPGSGKASVSGNAEAEGNVAVGEVKILAYLSPKDKPSGTPIPAIVKNGKYLIEGIDSGTYTIEAFGKHIKRKVIPKVKIEPGNSNVVDIRLVCTTKRTAVRGRVVDESGKEIKNARVFVYPPDITPVVCKPCFIDEVVSGDQGEIALNDLDAGEAYAFSVEVKDQSAANSGTILTASAITLGSEPRSDIELRVGPERTLTATVVRAPEPPLPESKPLQKSQAPGYEVAANPTTTQPPVTVRPIRPSQKASVMQTFGVTDITITYSRPGVKGRAIWGDAPGAMEARAKGEATLDLQNERKPGEPIVPYNHIWRAGANEATLFQVSDDVLVNGQPLKAGSYSLHTIPGKEEWTVIFNSDPGQWGSFNYDSKKDTLRVKTKPQLTTDSVEWLSYTIEPTGSSSARVNLRWENLSVPFTVEVKDVKALWRAKADAVMAANPTNEQLPRQVALTYLADKNYDEALKFIDQSIKIKETFQNLSSKANILWAAGKKDEALAVADAAIAKGKLDKANTLAFEQRVADMKAGRP